MKKLVNTLYVTTPEAYLSLDGENVVVTLEKETLGRVPLHALEGIVAFNYTGASPALIGACAQRNVDLCFFTANNRFLARVSGAVRGNVLLRKIQMRWSEDGQKSLGAARYMIAGKIHNAKWQVARTLRDHAGRLDADKFREAGDRLRVYRAAAMEAADKDALRGVEAVAAAAYFSVFDDMILGDKTNFFFHGRNRRPPLDRMNALLSFIYAMLAREMAAALEGVGLDPCVGFLHTERPGRPALALDMMEELRAPLADRFVLSMVNRRMIDPSAFHSKEGGGVIMEDSLRREVLSQWQQRKREIITHPFLDEKIPWGMVPHAQALLLARWMRGDLDGYPPFLWK